MPSRACCSNESTLTTTPSVSYGSSWRLSRQASVNAMTPSMSRPASWFGLTVKPRASSRAEAPRDWLATARGGPAARLVLDELVGPRRELACRGDRGVLLAQRAGAGVPRVGVQRQAQLLALRVDPGELGLGHVHLAAGVERDGLGEARRHGRDRAQVRGHVLAGRAVAARRALDEPAALVAQRDREAVDLELGDVAQVRRPAPGPAAGPARGGRGHRTRAARRG